MTYEPQSYRCIALWGRSMGSFPYYIADQQALAAADGAPIDAIYKNVAGRWVRLGEVENAPLREALTTKLAALAA